MYASAQSESPGSMEIVSARDFAAPRETLFGVFADPAELAQWWGPKGFSNTITRFDFRSGGAWRFTMHGPDGTDYPNAKDFIEVEEPGRIVFQHLDPKHRFTMTMTFEPLGNAGGTRLTWRMLFDPNRENENLRGFIVAANEQNFDRLGAHLAARNRIDLDGKTFKSFSNSDNGDVGAETRFRYHEDGNAVWAEYSGGTIVRGGMIGLRLPGNALDMRYQHLSEDGKIKTGVCRTKITIGASGKITLDEVWKWTCDDFSEGESVLIEV